MESTCIVEPAENGERELSLREHVMIFLTALYMLGDVFEIRAMGIGGNDRRVDSGYFNCPEKAADAVCRLENVHHPRAIYTGLNPCAPELLARTNNTIKAWVKLTTSDDHIERYRWLFIDLDSIRGVGVSGISATAEEVERTRIVALAIRKHMASLGFHEPIEGDSGNGTYLLYAIDLSNDEASKELVRGILKALSARFTTRRVEVDTKVFNPARIGRVLGTWNRKGADLPERPHRLSKVLCIPDYLEHGHCEPIPRETLEKFVASEGRTKTTVSVPSTVRRETSSSSSVTRRARKYLQKLPPAVSGQNGHDAAFLAAQHLVRGFQLSESEALTQIHEWNLTCQPPWSEAELQHKIKDATTKGTAVELGAHLQTQNAKSTMGHAIEHIDDPHRLARLCIQDFTTSGIRIIQHWRGTFHLWNGVQYTAFSGNEVELRVTGLIKNEFDRVAKNAKEEKDRIAKKVTRSLVQNVIQALKSMCHISEKIEQPAWLGNDVPFDPSNVFATKNCLLDLSAAANGECNHIPPTPQFFSPNGVDYEFDPDAKCDTWREFLRSVWPDDDQSIEALQELFGYCLLPDTSQHKLAMIIGPPRSGKGLISGVLTNVIGLSNVASPTLNALPSQFGLWPLLGKSLAIIGDARLSGRADAVAIVERLLSISGEDRQNVDRKNLAPLIGIRLPVRFLILSNELPNFNDASGAIMSRVLLLKMTQSFEGREDRGLRKRLTAELPGILNWAIEGWGRLNKRGHFVQPEMSQELVDDLSQIASPIGEFIADRCVVGPEYCISIKELYLEWKRWCEEQGRDRPGSKATFGKNLRAALHSIERDRETTGTRERFYRGIALKLVPPTCQFN